MANAVRTRGAIGSNTPANEVLWNTPPGLGIAGLESCMAMRILGSIIKLKMLTALAHKVKLADKMKVSSSSTEHQQ
jgi:hypothetical protein